MSKICTSIEQSKRLVELGLDIETADMLWQSYQPNTYDCFPITSILQEDDDILAWSLSALLQFLPKYIDEGGATAYYLFIYPTWRKTWMVIYETPDHYVDESRENPDLLDSVYEMVCWLLEEKKI